MARREKVFNEHRQKLTCGGERLCGEFVFSVAVLANCVKTLPPVPTAEWGAEEPIRGGVLGCVIFFEKGVLAGCGARLECLGKGVAGVWFKGWNAFFQNLMHERF